MRRLKAENESLQKRLKMMEHALPQRSGGVGEGLDQAMGEKEERDTFQLRQLPVCPNATRVQNMAFPREWKMKDDELTFF